MEGNEVTVVPCHDLEVEAFPPPSAAVPAVPGLSTLQPVGSGPRGVVYRASNGKRAVAVKVFRPRMHVDRAVLERFLRHSPRSLRHPNLPLLESCGETGDGVVFYSMPFLSGDSLEEILRDLRLGKSRRPSLSPLAIGAEGETHPELPCRAAEIIAEVAEGLALAHAEGIVHRRLTPRNLIFSAAGRLVITDFGGEVPIREEREPVHRRALIFRAPETLSVRSPPAGPEMDVYALGVMLYELLARRPPFEEDKPGDLKRAIRKGSFTPPSRIPNACQHATIPRALEACVLKAMAFDPECRYAGAGALASDLRRFLRGELPLALKEASRGEEMTAPARPRPPRSHLGAAWSRERRVAVLVFSFLAVAAAFWGGNRLRPRPSDGLAGPGGSSLNLDIGAGREQVPDQRRNPDLAIATARAWRDPLLAALESPLRAAAGLDRLSVEITAGERPRDDARLAARLLNTGDAEIRRRAIKTLALLSESQTLIETLAIGEERPVLQLDAETFAVLHEALAALAEREADEASEQLLCAWDLEICELLDGAPRPTALEVPPNLAVELKEDAPRDFTTRWIRTAATLDAERLVAEAGRLGLKSDLLPALIPALAAAGTPEAAAAISQLARSDCLSAGAEALRALAGMGAPSLLLELAGGELPLGFRREALRHLAAAFPGVYFPELARLARSSPEPSLRQSAFAALATCDLPLAAAAIPSAVDDLDLRPAALVWLQRLPLATAADPSLDLLRHEAAEVREAAVGVLSRACPPRIARALCLDLLSPRQEVRRAALAVLDAQASSLVVRSLDAPTAFLRRWKAAAIDRWRRLPALAENALQACKRAFLR